ncbi:MAG TPA: dihydropyrimidinase [Steroidobacteraceae bacterium]|nr:dihydropyrimidinase [Steroidobacteraceae bacterium]
MALELVIRNGTIVTAADTFRGDIGVADGRVAVLGTGLGRAEREIDATGLLVMPGGVDAHCHIDEPPYRGARLADDFASATRAAACGGTTTLIPFANQLAGRSLHAAVEDYHARARDKALIDYAFHIILTDASQAVIDEEIPALMAAGYKSIKVFMTYPGYMLSDDKIMDVMDATQRHGGTVMVHAENGHCMHWLAGRLESQGHVGLDAFTRSAPAAVEREATHRAITLAELTGARVMLVHVSSADALEQIEWGRDRGLPVIAETCPQYLIDAADKLNGSGWEPAKYLCAPPPRGGDNAERLWAGVRRGSFQLLSSDHCPYRFEGVDGKRAHGSEPHFRHVPPGVPGLETRMPLLFDEGVLRGRLSAQQFVALTATHPARTYGLYPRKGTLAPGADADIVLWDTATPVDITHDALHDACDYTPYEGRRVGAWPSMTISRGETIWNRGWISDHYGRGRFLQQGSHG